VKAQYGGQLPPGVTESQLRQSFESAKAMAASGSASGSASGDPNRQLRQLLRELERHPSLRHLRRRLEDSAGLGISFDVQVSADTEAELRAVETAVDVMPESAVIAEFGDQLDAMAESKESSDLDDNFKWDTMASQVNVVSQDASTTIETGAPTPAPVGGGSNTGTIGGALGAVALVGVAAAAAVYRRRQSDAATWQKTQEEAPGAVGVAGVGAAGTGDDTLYENPMVDCNRLSELDTAAEQLAAQSI